MRDASDRKRKERERKRNAGFILIQEWVHREDADRFREYAIKLRLKRIVNA